MIFLPNQQKLALTKAVLEKLVGWWLNYPSEKYAQVKLDHFPRVSEFLVAGCFTTPDQKNMPCSSKWVKIFPKVWVEDIKYLTSWWLNQPIWKICSSNWIISPRIGVKIKNIWNHQLVENSRHHHCRTKICAFNFSKMALKPTLGGVCQGWPGSMVGKVFLG